MLQAIRDRAQTWLAWVIVGFISIPFALWGIQEYLGAGGPQLAAEVEGIEISVDEYRDTVDSYRQQQRARLQQIFGNDLDNPVVQKLLDDKVIKQQALDGMIAGRLLAFAAVEAGFNIGEAQIDAMGLLGDRRMMLSIPKASSSPSGKCPILPASQRSRPPHLLRFDWMTGVR